MSIHQWDKTVECTCSLSIILVKSLGAWTIDESSPFDPVLRHGDNFLPDVPHFLHF